MTDGIRTFIAFETPAEVRAGLVVLQNSLRKAGVDLRWESEEKLHCTIKFLGDVPVPRLGAVLELIGRTVALFPRFTVVYEHLGVFPNLRRPRVLWAGCRDVDGTLARIKTAVDEALVPEGFPVEERSFHPHVTLGRMRDVSPPGNLTPMLENLTFEPHIIQVGNIVVMKSVLRPQGALYSVQKEIQLR
jgi:2'-5' RNA ligase